MAFCLPLHGAKSPSAKSRDECLTKAAKGVAFTSKRHFSSQPLPCHSKQPGFTKQDFQLCPACHFAHASQDRHQLTMLAETVQTDRHQLACQGRDVSVWLLTNHPTYDRFNDLLADSMCRHFHWMLHLVHSNLTNGICSNMCKRERGMFY